MNILPGTDIHPLDQAVSEAEVAFSAAFDALYLARRTEYELVVGTPPIDDVQLAAWLKTYTPLAEGPIALAEVERAAASEMRNMALAEWKSLLDSIREDA